MSVTRVQLVGNVSTGASFVGVVTATSFSGNVTGTATGLSGTPNITVGTITATSLNASGVVTATSFSGSGANLTGIANTANIRSDTITVGVLTATSINVPPVPITFSPAIGATSVAVASNIIITFSQSMQKGTGNITLRENSAGGTAFSTIGVSSSSVTISGGAVTIDPPSNIGFAVTTFVVVDAGAFAGITTTSTSALINTYSFTTADLAVGDSYEGGFLICKASPLRWVVSPRSAEVSRTWYLREDANTTAQSVSGCTGWFVPTKDQLQNPGYCCRSFWGPSPCYSSTGYWSSTEFNADNAYRVNFGNGTAHTFNKTNSFCVRSFRCVTY